MGLTGLVTHRGINDKIDDTLWDGQLMHSGIDNG